MDSARKDALNRMKCPICGGQIEGVTQFHCVLSKTHYKFVIVEDIFPISITHEYVSVNDGRKQYYIIQTPNETEIYVHQLDGNYEIISPDKTKPAPKSFKFDQKIFSFSETNREKLLNRIRTIIVFS